MYCKAKNKKTKSEIFARGVLVKEQTTAEIGYARTAQGASWREAKDKKEKKEKTKPEMNLQPSTFNLPGESSCWTQKK